MNKKQLFIVSVVALTLAAKVDALAETTISVGNSTGGAGENVMVPITLASDETVVGLQFDVIAQDGKLTSIEAAKGSVLESSHLLQTNHELDNSRILIYSNNNRAIADGEVLQLTFGIHDTATPGTIDVSLTGVLVSGPRAAGVSTTSAAGTINIQNANGSVEGRYVFYNNSYFDSSSDSDAIATDKSALLPGGTATFANYTSYTEGINGVMIDIEGLGSASNIGADDFTFKVGNNNNPSGWSNAPAPSEVSVEAGAGTAGSDRIKIIWANKAITKQWLEVTVLANADTGLAENDVFYFGNAIGDTGDSTLNAQVGISDENRVRNNPRNFLNRPGIDFAYDLDRNGLVNLSDSNAARNNGSNFLTALRLITPPAISSGSGGLIGSSYEPVRVNSVASIQLVIRRDDSGQLVVEANDVDPQGVELQFKEGLDGEWHSAPPAEDTPNGARWTFLPGPRQMLYRLIQK